MNTEDNKTIDPSLDLENNEITKTMVTYWPKLNLVYWAVHKCGTTTIKNHLLFHEDGRVVKNEMRSHRPKWHRRLPQEYREGSTNFTVVRHPYTRFSSMYNDMFLYRPNYRPQNALKVLENKLDMTQLEFANYLLEKEAPRQMNIHFRPSRWFLRDKRIKVLRLEELATDWCFDFPAPEKRLNQTAENYPELSEDVKAVVDKVYAGDFDIWESREVKYPWPEELPADFK